MRISVIIAEDSKKPRKVRINNDFDNFEKIIGGTVEIIRSGRGYAALCDANGWAKKLPVTCSINGIQLVGPVIFTGVDKDKLVDIPMSLSEFLKEGNLIIP